MFTFDPYSPQVDADPFPFYKVLRDEHPCYWSEPAKMWVLSRYADISHAGQEWQTYSSAPRWAPPIRRATTACAR